AAFAVRLFHLPGELTRRGGGCRPSPGSRVNCRSMKPESPLVVRGNIVDPVARTITPSTLTIRDGVIADVQVDATPHATYLTPGFVDAHVHVESSMLVPSEFARLAVRHG